LLIEKAMAGPIQSLIINESPAEEGGTYVSGLYGERGVDGR
jgi:hypothetical protein